MNNNLTKSLFCFALILTSCGTLFYEPSPVLKVNDNEITLNTVKYVDGNKCITAAILPPDTKQNAQSCVRIADASSYVFNYNVTHELKSLSFQYLDSEFNAIFTKEEKSSLSGLTKKNWYGDESELGTPFYDYTYDNDILSINHPIEDYNYIFVLGFADFKNSHERETYFYFVIEK